MLRNTFCHIPGIGLVTEKRLWSSGVHSWEDLLGFQEDSLPVQKRRVYGLKRYVEQSISHLQDKDFRYFAELLPSDQAWRVFADFRGTTAYLDIETTGMGNWSDHITTIALYDGKTVSWYVYGRNLEDFGAELQKYDVIVTYNGKCFDLPFITNALGIEMNQAHIDLRYVLKSLGYGGGLKRCEKQFGIDREALDGVDGFFAVLLWGDYERNGNPKALETLLAYNIQDTVNLESLMVQAYNLKVKETPFHEILSLDLPLSRELPFEADPETIDRLRTLYFPGRQW